MFFRRAGHNEVPKPSRRNKVPISLVALAFITWFLIGLVMIEFLVTPFWGG